MPTMANDLEIIKQIEKELGCELEQVKEIEWNTRGYVLNEQAEVVGLGLYDCEIGDLKRIIYLLKELKKMTLLNSSRNQLSDISVLKELKNLTQLDLSDNLISDISVLKELKKLTQLNLTWNQLSDISVLKELKNLTKLNLSGNQVSDISALKELKNLTVLHLSINGVSDISVLKELKKLAVLGLGRIKVRDVSPLKELKNLTELYLIDNQVSDISVLKELKNLNVLYLSDNQVSDISVLKELKKLAVLGLGRNKVRDVSPLKELKNLTKVNLTGNQISDISVLKELKNITELNLSWNQIKELSYEVFVNLDKIENWDDALENNPLERPPWEIIKQGKEAIRDWFEQEKVENNEVKLILLGNSAVGKTSLVKFLLTGQYDDTQFSTHGINIERWRPNGTNLNVNIWDFGGQEYYHATHRLFLTSQSLYLILWEKNTNKTKIVKTKLLIAGNNEPQLVDLQHYDYYYWFNLIKHYDRNLTSPILVVQNKIDLPDNKEESIDKRLLDEFKAKQFHISIKKAYEEKDNFDSEYVLKFKLFKKELVKTLLERAKGIIIQRYIARVREAIRKRANENIWDWQTYAKFCKDNAGQELTDKQIKILTKYLHDTGVILYYGYDEDLSENSLLKDIVFINPKFVTETIYQILDYKVQENNGEFTREHVINKLKDEKLADLFIELMLSPNFELIFPKPQARNTYIAAQYLPDEPAIDVEAEKRSLSLAFGLKFTEFMHRFITTKFFSRYGSHADSQKYWKNGIYLYIPAADKTVRVLVIADFEKKIIEVYTNEAFKRSSIITEIYETLVEISTSNYEANKDTIELYFDSPQNSAQISFFERNYEEFKFKYTDRLFIKLGENKRVNLMEFVKLKNGFKIEERISVFVSYSQKDEEIKDKIIGQLKSDKVIHEKVKIWHDRMIEDKWEDEIKEEIEKSSIFLVIVSSNLCSNPEHYVFKRELPLASEKRKRIIPVIYTECIWREIDILKDADAVPEKGEAINEFQTIDKGILIAVSELKKKIYDQLEKQGLLVRQKVSSVYE